MTTAKLRYCYAGIEILRTTTIIYAIYFPRYQQSKLFSMAMLFELKQSIIICSNIAYNQTAQLYERVTR